MASTVSSVQYAVLANEVDMTRDELQGLLMALCYNHPVSANGVSIPEPVFRAHELAKRGYANFTEMR